MGQTRQPASLGEEDAADREDHEAGQKGNSPASPYSPWARPAPLPGAGAPAGGGRGASGDAAEGGSGPVPGTAAPRRQSSPVRALPGGSPGGLPGGWLSWGAAAERAQPLTVLV